MAQIRGTAGYHLGNSSSQHSSSFGNMGNIGTNDPSPLSAIRAQTSKIEDWLDTIADPLKPYLPAIGRFLIVVTFLEDALRILTQWGDQLVYLREYRHSELLSPLYCLEGGSTGGKDAGNRIRRGCRTRSNFKRNLC